MNNSLINKLKNKGLKNIFITLFLRGAGVVTLFGFTLFLTNNYSAEVVGNYEIIRVFLLVLGSISTLGTEQSILYFVGKLTSENKFSDSIYRLYKDIITIIFFVSLAIILLFLIIPKKYILSFYSNDLLLYKYIKETILVCFFYSFYVFNVEFIRGLGSINLSEIFRNIVKFIPVIIGSFLLLFMGNQIWIIDFYIYGFIILSLITFIIIYRKIKQIRNNNDFKISYIEIFKKSYPMSISGLCMFIMLSVDVFLLNKYFNSAVVAYYSIGVKLLTILTLVIVAINTNIAPKISELYHDKNIQELKKLLNKSRNIICGLNYFVGFFLILFGKFILKLFGENYTEAYIPMVILVSSQMIASLFGSSAVKLNMIGKQNSFQFILILSTLLNIILNIIFIPIYGMIGAAISYGISLLLWNILSSIYFNKSLKSLID